MAAANKTKTEIEAAPAPDGGSGPDPVVPNTHPVGAEAVAAAPERPGLSRFKTPQVPPESFRVPLAKEGRLHVGRLKEAVGARQTWFADVPAGTPPETILHPEYWGHHCTRQIRPMDLIEAFCEDGSWEAMLRVMFVGRAEIQVSRIYQIMHDAQAAIDTDPDYEIKWMGPGAKFCIVSRGTKAVIKDHLYPRSEAVAYLHKQLRHSKT